MHLCNGQSCKCVSMCVHFLSVWCLCPPLTLCSYLAMTHPHSFIPQPSPPCSFTHIRHVIHCRALLGTTWPKSVFSSAQLTTHKLNHRCTWHLGHWQDIRWGQKNPGDEEKQWTFAVILPLWIWKPAAHTLVSLLCLPVKRYRNREAAFSHLKPSQGFRHCLSRALITAAKSKVFFLATQHQDPHNTQIITLCYRRKMLWKMWARQKKMQ